MTLNLWLVAAVVVVVMALAALGLFLWRRRRQTPFSACPRCFTVFDPTVWKVRNRRQHYQGRYTITPVYKCPKCGFEMSPMDLL